MSVGACESSVVSDYASAVLSPLQMSIAPKSRKVSLGNNVFTTLSLKYCSEGHSLNLVSSSTGLY